MSDALREELAIARRRVRDRAMDALIAADVMAEADLRSNGAVKLCTFAMLDLETATKNLRIALDRFLALRERAQ